MNLKALPKVRADVDRIKEALVNVAINACEAMKNGGRISITESRDYHPELGEVAVIAVNDTGSGIPAPFLDRVTKPFFSTREEGSGLGLSVVARIVREHNGIFTVASNSEGGARCVFHLPTGGIDNESYPDN